MNARLMSMVSVLALCAGAAAAENNFNRIASFPVASNWGGKAPDVTSPEIIDATADGMTLVYTDSPGGVIGAIDITDPRREA